MPLLVLAIPSHAMMPQLLGVSLGMVAVFTVLADQVPDMFVMVVLVGLLMPQKENLFLVGLVVLLTFLCEGEESIVGWLALVLATSAPPPPPVAQTPTKHIPAVSLLRGSLTLQVSS